MRATSLIPYIYKEKNYKYKNNIQHTLYIQNTLLYVIYIDKHVCSSCNKECFKTTCYLYKYSSKISYNIFICYKFYCSNISLCYI
jgi:hypothetical protein